MTNEEIYARCNNCENIDKCAEALGGVIWTTHISIPKDINCEYFPELGEAIKEYVHKSMYDM